MLFFKKMLALATSLLISAGVVGLYAVPTEEVRADAYSDVYKTEGDWEYTVMEDETAHITGYDGDDVVIEIPKSINGMKVTGIGGNIYRGFCSELVEKVTIPDTVTRIEAPAFWGCTALAEIVLPDSVTYIDGKVFEGTKWLADRRAESPFVIVNGILVDAAIAEGEVKIPDGVTKISPWAFVDNKTVTRVEMPQTVTDIGYRAFEKCTSLKKVELSEGLTEISFALFMGCEALESVNIPWRVTDIAMYAFSGCRLLEKIDIPFGVTEIGSGAFEGTAIKNITLPEGMTKIENATFAGCRLLESIKIPKSVEEIEGDLFFASEAEKPIIYGYWKTAAETYAYENNIAFMVLDTNPSDDAFATVTVNPAAGDTAAKFEMEKTDIMSLFSSILTKEQFEAAVYGKVRFDIALSVTKADGSVSKEDKERILDAVDLASKEGKADFKILNYFDIRFGAVVDDKEVNVSETSDSIIISIPLDNTMNGVYKVVRIHDGKTDILDAQLNGDGTRLVFETDKFSTYAVIYSDVASGGDAPNMLTAAFLIAGVAVIAAGAAVVTKKFNVLSEI